MLRTISEKGNFSSTDSLEVGIPSAVTWEITWHSGIASSKPSR
jgi:hypothetical protein